MTLNVKSDAQTADLENTQPTNSTFQMPRPTPRLIFKSASSQWRRHALAAATAPIKIFSPYITGSQTFGLAAGRAHAEVYTLFDAELFMSRASDLKQLRTLLQAGVELYFLPELHAKLVWIPGIYLSIGSQNLTSKGMRNKEATAAVLHEPWLDRVEPQLDRWVQERKPITLEMIEDMERAVAPFLGEYQKMKAKLVAADEVVAAAEAARERARQEAIERQHQETTGDRRALFARSFRRLRTSTEITAVVKEFASGSVSLVAAPGYSFLRWTVDGSRVDLRTLNRYLCVVPELGRLGWARLSNTRITYVESSVRSPSTRFLGKKCVVEWSASQRLELTDYNLTFELSGHPDLPDFALTAWVDADHIELTSEEGIDEEVLSRWDEISAEIVRHLTQRFKYGRKLTGKTADEFFYAHVGSEFRVRLARLAGHNILVAEAVSRS